MDSGPESAGLPVMPPKIGEIHLTPVFTNTGNNHKKKTARAINEYWTFGTSQILE